MSTPIYIVKRFGALSQFVAKGVLFNLNYLPDTILGGIVLFALLLQSAPLALLGISLFSLEFVHGAVSLMLANAIPDLRSPTEDVGRCSGHFPGVSFERVAATLISQGTLKNISVGFPSYYMMFFGALFGYVLAMAQTYQRELQGLPQKRAAIYAGVVVMGLLTVLFMVSRVFTNCDTPISVVVGALAGLLYGFMMEGLIAYLSDRSLTNLINTPLIRNRAEDGKPIYVCKKG
jgi:hypothetical protein